MVGKNRREVRPGLSLTRQAMLCAWESDVFDRIVLLTDDPELAVQYPGHAMVRPPELSTDTSDISEAVAFVVRSCYDQGQVFDYVTTLQPAVLARSPFIVRNLVRKVSARGAAGGITMARSHPWNWLLSGTTTATNGWFPGIYPRSQDTGRAFVEINAVQVASTRAIADGKRWGLPLLIAELPAWTTALDIDTEEDLAEATALWPFAESALATYSAPIHRVENLNGISIW